MAFNEETDKLMSGVIGSTSQPSPSSRFVEWFHAQAPTQRADDLHHRIGLKAWEAAAGDHTHDGRNSQRIKFSDIEGGIFNLDGGHADSVYGGIPIIDGGSI